MSPVGSCATSGGEGFPALLMTAPPTPTMAGLFPSQEKRRAERAEQQRIRSEREKERQARMAVSDPSPRPPAPPTLQRPGPDHTQ